MMQKQKQNPNDYLIEQIKIQKELTRRDCINSFFNFLQYFWNTIIPEPLVLNWHMKYLCAELQLVGERVIAREKSEYDLIINIPPGTTKSTIATVMFPAWLWLRDATIRTISGSYSADIAIEHAVKSRQILKSYKFLELYGNLIEFKPDQDNKKYYENMKGGSRAAVGVGGAITGKHGHLLIIDDPINPKQSASEAFRKTANDWMDKTLSTRKVDKAITPMIIIMQRLHEEDPSGYRLKKGKVKHICLPAEVTDLQNIYPPELEDYYQDGMLDPQRMGREVLSWERENLGSVEYAGQFLQSPTAAEGNLFKREWFKFYDELPAGRPWRIINSWDTAFKEKEQNDPSACTTWMEFENGFYLVDYVNERMTYPDLKKRFILHNAKWHSMYDLIEDTASGQVLIQEMSIEGKIAVVAIKVDKDKVARAKTATPAVEAGKVFLPNADWTNIILDQLCGFPNTKHDDLVDTVTQFLNWVRENPFSTPPAIGRRRKNSVTRGYYEPAKF
jgi:predicted phage terminase large subunit-like protein